MTNPYNRLLANFAVRRSCQTWATHSARIFIEHTM